MFSCLKLIPILILALTTITAKSTIALCPNEDDIKPCNCDDEGFQCLKLNNTDLARVFAAPAEHKAIRRVWIYVSNLTTLDRKVFGDYIIRDLYLDLNQISHIESGAFGEAVTTLQSLSLTRNLLKSFPFEDLKSMKKLRQLGLGRNQLVEITSGALPPSNTLESLDLSHNSIELIEANAFAELYEVSLIDLSRNKLKEIDSNTLLVKSSSRHLAISLRANQISKIAADAFGRHHPHTLDLSRNKLTYLEELTFAPLLLNNTVIDVDENPFSCTGCRLYRWLLDLKSEHLSNIINFACTDETKLEDLTPEMIGCSAED